MDLDVYKPNPSVHKAFEINEALPPQELAFDVFKKLVLARRAQDAVFLSIGKMLKLMRDQKLYKNLDYDTFEQFLNSEELSFSREKAYLYIRTFELFVEKLQLDADELGKLGVVRLMVLHKAVKDLPRDQAIEKIEEMKHLRYNDFIKTAQNETDRKGKPGIYFSEERQKWIVNYYEDKTELISLGQYSIEVEGK